MYMYIYFIHKLKMYQILELFQCLVKSCQSLRKWWIESFRICPLRIYLSIIIQLPQKITKAPKIFFKCQKILKSFSTDQVFYLRI